MTEKLRFKGKIGNTVFTTDGYNRWWAAIPVAIASKQSAMNDRKVLGVALGTQTRIVAWDGQYIEKIEIPKNGIKSTLRLAKLQRKLSRQIKGSNRYKKTKKQIKNLYEHEANRRDWDTHQATNEIISQASIVGVRTISVSKLVRKKSTHSKKDRNANRALLNASPYRTTRQMAYKLAWKGGELKILNDFEPTTATCSHCGVITDQTKNRSLRIWTCVTCNSTHDRLENSAKNIYDLIIDT